MGTGINIGPFNEMLGTAGGDRTARSLRALRSGLLQ